jgi:hypothetical protein
MKIKWRERGIQLLFTNPTNYNDSNTCLSVEILRYLFFDYMTLLNIYFPVFFQTTTFEMQRYLCDAIKIFHFPVFKKKIIEKEAREIIRKRAGNPVTHASLSVTSGQGLSRHFR